MVDLPDFNIDESDPYIDGMDVPGEARPGETFSVTVTVGNRSTITAPQSGTCQSGIFGTNVAWRTPVRVLVDGEVVHEESKCIDGSSGTKSVVARLTLDPGEHDVEAQVLKQPEGVVHDERAGTVRVSERARNPAEPTRGDKLAEWFEEIAATVGGTTTQLALGALAAVVLLGVL